MPLKFFTIALFPAFLLLNNCNSTSISPTKLPITAIQQGTPIVQPPIVLPFDSIKKRYKTLIPLFDGLFVTYSKIDSAHYKQFWASDSLANLFSGGPITKDTEKWGVVDSSGNIIVPFICDGVKTVSKNKGVATIYESSRPLNTGLPRYRYKGKSFFFTKAGRTKEKEKPFELTVVMLADWHDVNFVISQGPTFYLPLEFRDPRSVNNFKHGAKEQ